MNSGPTVHVRHLARSHAVAMLGCSALVAALLAAAPAGVRAAASSSSPSPTNTQLFGVHPALQGSTTLPGGHFNFAVLPGERVADAIVVENFSNHSLTFHVYGADLMTAVGGGSAPAQQSAPMHEVGAWITVSEPIVTIAAHREVTDAFTVQLPSNVPIGQHLGAVVAAADVGTTPQGNPIQARAALITVVTVPGAAHPMASISALSGSEAIAGTVGFDVTLANTGNVLLTYSGFVTIDDSTGHRVATVQLTPVNAYVVPTGDAALAASWKEATPRGTRYSATATVTILADGKAVRTLTSQSLAFTFPSAFPILIVAVSALLLLAIVALVIGLRIRASRRRQLRRAWVALGTRAGGVR